MGSEKMATVLEYKCPCCGGAISFDTDAQKMKCPFCDTEVDVEAVKNMLDRVGDLDGCNRDLIDNAIYCLNNGSSYRAESSLRTLASNLRHAGKSYSAECVERLL
ncbi:MAG: hypothetical protein MJ230_08120 [bacterium]|nr:hypothetical protein [bacterium]